MVRARVLVRGLFLAAALGFADAEARAAGNVNAAPKGFTALFDGDDLSGWHGLWGDNPYEAAKWTPEKRARKQKEADEDIAKHWRVENGEIINDGHGVYLTTEKDYGDFELYVDWKLTVPNADSGIYLRGCPQVQIWDPDKPSSQTNGAFRGSGALWNNKREDGKWPAVKADRPIGEWNTFKITMIGSTVSVAFNGKLTVDHAIMENYWDRAKPLPARGPIQLQTHGGEIRFRSVFIREIPPDEANRMLAAHGDDGFTPIFSGKDLAGWTAATDAYTVDDGMLVCKPRGAGTIYTEKTFRDFAVRFEFKLPPGGNNGLCIRAPLDQEPSKYATEIQILDDTAEKYTDLHDWQYHGSIYGVVPAHRGYLRPVGEWNFEEVIARGPRVEVNLNGTPIVDADLSKIDASLTPKKDASSYRRTEGHVGFMAHGDPVALRNIRVKPLE